MTDPNYAMKFGVSEAAHVLEVDSKLIMTWAYHFSDYLNSEAKPRKGITPKFCLNDIRVFAYAYMYWEDNPDIESIKYGLNSNDHFESPINEFIVQAIPIFREPQDDMEDNCLNGVIFGGMSELGDIFALADSYKLAGDKLVEVALKHDEQYELICPVVYNYRHATELYLKAIINPQKPTHDLRSLLQIFKILLEAKFHTTPPTWFENIILAFNDFDPNGTTFRYGGAIRRDEVFVDLSHMKTLMTLLAESFQKIREQSYG